MCTAKDADKRSAWMEKHAARLTIVRTWFNSILGKGWFEKIYPTGEFVYKIPEMTCKALTHLARIANKVFHYL